MKKINNKGFVLAETLVVAVFIMSIFTIIFVNFYPLMAQYERREFYDDIDSKYDIYWFKRMIENKNFLPDSNFTSLTNQFTSSSNGYASVTCSNIVTTNNYRTICDQYKEASGLKSLYLTSYHLDESKIPTVKTSDVIQSPKYHLQTPEIMNALPDEDLIDYVRYLPRYNYESLNGAKYRIIGQFERKYHGGNYKSFATIEVNR